MNQLTAITDQEIEESILKYKGIKIANKIEDNYCILEGKSNSMLVHIMDLLKKEKI